MNIYYTMNCCVIDTPIPLPTCASLAITHPEYQYLKLIKDIKANGSSEETRNGETLSLFGYSMRFSLANGSVPLLTTKKLAWKTCFKELEWFLKGSTDNDELIEKNVHIWDGNATREFLDSRGLTNNKVGDLGPIYGHQWRHYNAPYEGCSADYTGKGIDQIAYIIDCLKDPAKRSSRRMVMSAWNPCQMNEMAIPPCHVLAQFYVRQGKYLSCSLYQRSGDVGLGVPFNIASYSFLTHILAKHCGLEAEEFVHFLGDAHIYKQHIDVLNEQTYREPKPFPRMVLKTQHSNIEDYSIDDIEWTEPYEHHPPIKMELIA